MKLIFMAFVFFAGFATAIHMVGDVDQQANSSKAQFVQSFNCGMNKCLAVAKVATIQATKFIKQKMDERQVAQQSQ